MSAIREGRFGAQPPVPLFHSAADFLPEDPEHEQEVEDLYALKSSRRHFGAYGSLSKTRSEEEEDDGGGGGSHSGKSLQELEKSKGRNMVLFNHPNIKSSWHVSQSGLAQSSISTDSVSTERAEAAPYGKGKEKMMDVRLEDSERLGSVSGELNDKASHKPAFFGYNHDSLWSDSEDGESPADLPQVTDGENTPFPFEQRVNQPQSGSDYGNPGATHNNFSATPQQVYQLDIEPPAHDHIWGTIYIFLLVCLFATSFVVWLHTEKPKKLRLADTIYNTLDRSKHLLAIDTILAVAVASAWLYLLRAFVKPLIYALLVAVPVVSVVLSVYPFVMSFKTGNRDYGAQDRAMRWGSFVPAIIAVVWISTAWKARQALHRAVGIIQLSCKILGDNPALIILSFGALSLTCIFTWVWMNMFTRAFLTGNLLDNKGNWVWTLKSETALLAIYYIMMYLWTLGILSGIHRATSAATVSQWYFHRHAIPTPSSWDVTTAALYHSINTLFGTICFYSLVVLLVRLPLYVAPRKIVGIIHLFCFQFISSPIIAIIDPLTLTYASIHSQPLVSSSRTVVNLKFVGASGYGSRKHQKAAYRLSKMLLTAARGSTALSLGIGAWVAAARGDSGSVYGYLVGLAAGSIGWAILGTTEGSLSNIVDATLVCVKSDTGGPSHCREAQLVFGG